MLDYNCVSLVETTLYQALIHQVCSKLFQTCSNNLEQAVSTQLANRLVTTCMQVYDNLCTAAYTTTIYNNRHTETILRCFLRTFASDCFLSFLLSPPTSCARLCTVPVRLVAMVKMTKRHKS